MNYNHSRQDWFNGTFPERTDPPCPSTSPPHDNWSDFCSGKYMHFDLITYARAACCLPTELHASSTNNKRGFQNRS